MTEHEYSQLPVVDEAGFVLGIFTVSAFVAAATKAQEARHLLDNWVEDYMEPAEYIPEAMPPDHMLRRLHADRALLVGGPESVTAIVTAADLLQHYHEATEPFIVLKEIETSVRFIITSCVQDERLAEALTAALGDRKSGVPTRLEDCNFEDYRLLMTSRHTREHFAGVIGPNSTLLGSRLMAVRNLRNQVMHFKQPLNVGELEVLRDARLWLNTKVRTAKQRGGLAEAVA